MARVLIVDDEKSIRLTLREFLREAAYEVETAEDAAAAQAMLTQKSFDVVVSDIVLPRLSGVDLLKAIRVAAPDVQVIMMTGEPTVETAVEAVQAGARDYLTKPVIKNAILRSVATAAQIKRIEDEKRRLEESNRQYQQNLEKLVAERTQALQEANQRLEAALAELNAPRRRSSSRNGLAPWVRWSAESPTTSTMPCCRSWGSRTSFSPTLTP